MFITDFITPRVWIDIQLMQQGNILVGFTLELGEVKKDKGRNTAE